MQFDNEPISYASFAFETDVKWDYRELQKHILDLPHNKDLKDSLTDEEKEDFYDLKNSMGTAYLAYVNNEYDPEFIKGKPLILVFDTLNTSDLKIITSRSKSLMKIVSSFPKDLSKESMENIDISKILETILADEELVGKLQSFIKDFLNAKVVDIQNTSWDKEKVFEYIATKSSIMNLQNLFNFCRRLNMSDKIKKKTFIPSAE